MRALREIIGGLSLAFVMVLAVLGGLWLALIETSPTAIQAPTSTSTNTSTLTVTPSPFLPLSPSPSPSLSPSSTRPRSATPTLPTSPSPTPSFSPTSPPFTATPCLPPPTWVLYVVAPGDTLFQLSLRFGVSTTQLQAANCLPTTEIKSNQVIYVPFLPTATVRATATVTLTATPVPDPLRINGLTLLNVQADATRPNGAIATLLISYSGGLAPHTIYNDNQPQPGNPIQILTDCNGTLLHTLRVLSADNQSVEYVYYYSPVVCP